MIRWCRPPAGSVFASVISDMSVNFQWPENPFWDFSLAVYAEDGVPTVCLELQERHGADINLLLYVAWAGGLGHRLTSQDLAKAQDAVKRWHAGVVVPLRGLRSALKSDAMGAAPELAETIRSEIKMAELNAERAEQIMLSGVLEKPGRKGSGEPRPAAESNMRAYLERLCGTLDKRDSDGIGLIAEAACRPG